MPGIKILGTGGYTPSFTLTNDMLETIVDTSDEWIRLRTGIGSRPIAGSDETSLSMALSASIQALSELDRSKLGVVICATLTSDYITPSLSCLLHRDLCLREDAVAIDINCACSGFVSALRTAYALLADLPGRTALVVGCEMLSRVTDYTDRETCILFGDGAGAAVIKRVESGVFSFDCGTRGNSDLLYCRARYMSNSPFIGRDGDTRPDALHMNGQEVYRFAIEACADSVSRVIDQAGAAVGEIDHFVFHQANKRIIDGAAKRLGASLEKFIIIIENHGNTSSASAALALNKLYKTGKIKDGDKIVLSAFGGGLAYASAYFTQGAE
jgi:3-oxoacyl-[acyl-carrier-protein] synthase-3